MQGKQQLDILSDSIDSTLGHLVNNFDFTHIRLPLVRNSFTLWRNLSYLNATHLPFFNRNPVPDLHFHLLADCKYLRQFVERLEEAEETLSSTENAVQLGKGMEGNIKTQVQMELVDQYSHMLWKHTLYCELFEDLISLPYLASLFPPNKKYRLAYRYAQISPLRTSEQGGALMEKVSEGILKKGIGELTEKVFTRTFLLRASSIAVRLNPVAIAATFAFSSLVDYYRQERREEDIVNRLQEMIQTCTDNLEFLRRIYEESLGLVGGVLKGDEIAKEGLLQRVGEVMEADWLQIVRFKDEDEWEVVVLEGDPDGDY